MHSGLKTPLKKKEQPVLLDEEVEKSLGHDDLWTMYFDGASSKDGSGVGVLFISP